MRRILKNSIITPDGKDLISRHVHDYKSHNGYSVDGGSFYLKRGFPKIQDYKENSVIDDGLHETRRDVLTWGKNYDKNMKLLPKTKWVKIKDLDTDHIWNILLNVKSIDWFMKEVLIEEILFREDIWYNN